MNSARVGALLLWIAPIIVLLQLSVDPARADSLADTVASLKPSIVGVGTMSYVRRPAGNLLGTGFVVADGHHVVTNAHVVPNDVAEGEEFVAVFVGQGRKVKALRSKVVARDIDHDLAIVRFEGPRMSPLTVASGEGVREGESLAFTGYPIEALHGIHTATHQGIVSSIIPVPEGGVRNSRGGGGNAGASRRYDMLQLDATAFPGHSGSPLYRPVSGEVVGIVSKISRQTGGEPDAAVSSGVTYAVPVRHLDDLLGRVGLLE